jgi:hypothetical protein
MKLATFLVVVLLMLNPNAARADEITDWTEIFYQAAQVANASPPVTARAAAIVQAAVFDAVNGIERRYTPIHVEPDAHAGASRRAAAVQAAYGALVKLFPAQQVALDEKRTASLAQIASGDAAENSVSIKRGVQWGQTVADAILAWRSTDGLAAGAPPFLGGNAVGEWRPTPPGFQAGAGVPFATMTPWVMQSPSQFRAPLPPVTTSVEYLADFEEIKLMGRANSSARTGEQTLYSRFWAASTPTYFWNRAAIQLAEEKHLTFSEKSRLLAQLNIAIADAIIGCWDTKYTYSYWRPITAITLAANDNNPFTIEDPAWTPLLATPNHPDYVSGHSCASGAAGMVLANQFGDNTPFVLDSDAPAQAGVTRFYGSFSAALEEVKNARIFAGIHFRTACDEGQNLGIAVAHYVINSSLQPLHGSPGGQ